MDNEPRQAFPPTGGEPRAAPEALHHVPGVGLATAGPSKGRPATSPEPSLCPSFAFQSYDKRHPDRKTPAPSLGARRFTPARRTPLEADSRQSVPRRT
ncbi:hypothetical protein O3P69_005888 [Scylla paramamosain]|uniref:Uncharacterized protein n=1 Tax=Scylla paramamosain TaxID=85552 RepID=A0AAW0U5N9_SCYPA